MKNICFSFTLLLCISWVLPAQAVSPNDISILVPLPEVSKLPLLISPEEGGRQGPLIPVNTFKALPQLVPEYDNSLTYHDQLKVLGIRIDPCFVEGSGPLSCRRQIRLVWQPVVVSSDVVTTRDAAVHSFYEFDDKTFWAIWRAWRGLALGDPAEPLQVHPRLRAQGLAGNYWKELRSLLLEHCGEKNLVRITAMNVMSGEQLWVFMGFEVHKGQTIPIQIARIERPSQGVIIGSMGFQNYNGRVMPPPPQDPDVVQFIADSSSVKKYVSEDQIKIMVGKFFEYENPLKHNPGTLDCVSCHVAAGATQWAEINFAHWDWKNDFVTRYRGSGNLHNTTRGGLRTNRLRSFGYFHNQPAISQRTINETAVTLQALTF